LREAQKKEEGDRNGPEGETNKEKWLRMQQSNAASWFNNVEITRRLAK